MITECPDFDLTNLAEKFTTCGDYTKDVILKELRYWQKQPDFLILLSETNSEIDGFLIGYRNRNSLWIAQAWNDGVLSEGREAIEMAREWAKERKLTSITAETKRSEMQAMKRYGLEEFSLIMRCEI